MAAMHTAKSNFSHLIMEKREKGHQLVTHGIYGCVCARVCVCVCVGVGMEEENRPFPRPPIEL
jgi:hypothetical protein